MFFCRNELGEWSRHYSVTIVTNTLSSLVLKYEIDHKPNNLKYSQSSCIPNINIPMPCVLILGFIPAQQRHLMAESITHFQGDSFVSLITTRWRYDTAITTIGAAY